MAIWKKKRWVAVVLFLAWFAWDNFGKPIWNLNVEKWAERYSLDTTLRDNVPPSALYSLMENATSTAGWVYYHLTGTFGLGFSLGALFFAFWDPVIRLIESRFGRVRRVKDWAPIDRIEAFRLGQWAALICGFNYMSPGDDPGARPWRDEFFFLKRAIEVGKFAVDLKGQNVDRKTLVTRAEITEFYKRAERRPRALFPSSAQEAGTSPAQLSV